MITITFLPKTTFIPIIVTLCSNESPSQTTAAPPSCPQLQPTRYTALLIRSGYPALCLTVHAEPSAAPSTARALTLQGKVRYCITVVALLLAVLTQWLGTAGQPFAPNEWLRDQLIILHNTDAPDPRILVVDIDEASLTALGPWPWPRDRLADLAEILLTHYSARGVAFDILLPEAGSVSGDQRLALLSQHAPLVLAQSFDYSTSRPQPLREGQLAAAYRGAPPAAVPATGYLANHAGLAAARHVGNIGFIPDADGALRRLPLYTSFEGGYYPALALALIQCCNKPTELPATAPTWMRIDYQRDWSAYTVVSAADILAQRIDPASASARLVLVGSSSLGIGDRVLMLENTWYSVISPESCSSILWRSWDYKEKAAEVLKLTAEDMLKNKLIDGIIREPIGAAHTQPEQMFRIVKAEIKKHLADLLAKDRATLVHERIEKFCSMGVVAEQ